MFISRSAPNPVLAQVDVQNRVNLALPQLPPSVQAQGIQVQKKSSAFMMVIAIYSPDERYDSDLYRQLREHLRARCAEAHPRRRTSRRIFGTPDYAMRIWLKPDRMAQLGVTATDVQQGRRATRTSNSPSAASASRRPAAGRAVLRGHRPPAG